MQFCFLKHSIGDALRRENITRLHMDNFVDFVARLAHRYILLYPYVAKKQSDAMTAEDYEFCVNHAIHDALVIDKVFTGEE